MTLTCSLYKDVDSFLSLLHMTLLLLHGVQPAPADVSTRAVSAGFFILSNALWGVYFWRDSWHSLEYIFGFLFITTWLVPFSLFLSVAANESVLPGGANAGMTFSSSSNNLTGDKSS